MLWLSECMDVPVIAKGDGKLVGCVKNVYFDKISRVFAYFGIETAQGGQLLLSVGAATPKQALLLDEATLAMLKEDVDVSALVPSLLGLSAYTLGGTKKGKVVDAKFSPTGELARLVLSDGDIPPSQIACIGDVVLVKNAKPATRIPRPKKDYPVRALKNESANDNGTPSPSTDVGPDGTSDPDTSAQNGDVAPQNADMSQKKTGKTPYVPPEGGASGQAPSNTFAGEALPVYAATPTPAISLGKGEPMFSQGALNAVLDGDTFAHEGDSHNPTRIICDYEFLLGRTLGADLLTYTGELLAPKGAVITASVVEIARAHGKLVDLTLNSVKQRP